MMPSATLVLLAALLGCACAATDYCMSQDQNPFARFGTRAPYEVSGANLDPAPRRLPGCKPVHLWLLGRHGTRHGREADIELIHRLPKLQNQIRGNKEAGRTVKLCEEDLYNIVSWIPGVDKSMAYALTVQGQMDLQTMGERYRLRYPELFDNSAASNFKFKYDETPRCQDSSKWFYRGIFGNFPASGEGSVDGLADFYNRCPAYLVPIGTDFVIGDFNKFKKGAEFSDMVRRVSSRLGFYHNLDVEDVDAMYTACSFELARNWSTGKASPWCAVFRDEDFEVLEYWYDMKEYYRTGYGHKVHEKLGCVPVKDLVKSLSKRVETIGATAPTGLVYHSHDTLLNQVVAFLDLYRDDAKLRENTFASMRDRKWRVTRFSPFASNLHAVLHECEAGERHRVQMFLNENLLPLADWGCDADSCTWAQFMAKFGHVLTDCKQRRLCWKV
ncbi:multiple inositol polyphosphate phosphatase 1-like [Thrips palmi]|uniref:Multiple inositol polyphosphate phosphatase 1 n=1 Tax=Thrips palmi TaxID=161013 RepID=A0A6P9AGT4_THRPL|nr:multiple inositol polyphosphate phosphatase 1-like [Thrips palmi]XP_034256671.1 multiple inositol polyphosphate phosphatase 1-like [Thrips palmi]XP_034256672.1 multiple inositol polyphosphate phosphatase 1-like [Thrips palmi]